MMAHWPEYHTVFVFYHRSGQLAILKPIGRKSAAAGQHIVPSAILWRREHGDFCRGVHESESLGTLVRWVR